MTACDLIAFGLLALFCTFHGLHCWVQIRRQHDQIRILQRMLVTKDDPVAIQNVIANDQAVERLARPNQPAHPNGMNRLPTIS